MQSQLLISRINFASMFTSLLETIPIHATTNQNATLHKYFDQDIIDAASLALKLIEPGCCTNLRAQTCHGRS